MIISIQSQVLHGHVGNSAATFPMQYLGVPVTAVPTALLSNHPHYSTMRGCIVDHELLRDLLLGVEERGLVDRSAILLTGYLGSAANGRVVAEFVARAKARNPALRYCCDPVMGDADLGYFTPKPLRDIFRERLIPLADILTPNAFEFADLIGGSCNSLSAMRRGVASLGRQRERIVVITGIGLADQANARVDTVALHDASGWKVSTPRLRCRPAGTGDLLTALLVSRLAQGAALPQALESAVSGVFAVLLNTAATNAIELTIIESREERDSRRPRFRAVEVRAEHEYRCIDISNNTSDRTNHSVTSQVNSDASAKC
jgi:pyridoxine kinase